MSDRTTSKAPLESEESRAPGAILLGGEVHNVPSASRVIAEEVLDVIERACPPDAELRLELARSVSRLLSSGVLARLQR